MNGRGVSYGRYGGSSRRYAATTNGSRPRAAEVCSNQAPELTDWPIERISEVVQPTDAQRLDELRAASAKAIEILQSGCPKDLPSIPTGRLSAMESRLQVMLAAVQTVRPALERFYRSLSDEQKARFNVARAYLPQSEPAKFALWRGITSLASGGVAVRQPPGRHHTRMHTGTGL